LDFLAKSRFIKHNDFKIIQLLNILFSVTTFLANVLFISQKDKLIYGLMKETESKDSTIEDLLKANN
jgi:hypothetical protein